MPDKKNSGKIITDDPRVAYFDRCAEGWDSDVQKVRRTLERLERCRGLLGFRGGQDVLEVGCGTGQITGWLAGQVAPGRVVGIDFSAQMLARAQAKSLPAEFRLLDICSAPAGEAAFDVAFCFHCFPHFRDQSAALANLAASLRPGGRLIVMHLAGSQQVNAMHSGFGGAVGQDHLPATERWPSLLGGAGFELIGLIDREDLFLLRARRT